MSEQYKQNGQEKRPLEKAELRFLVEEEITETGGLIHVARMTVNGRLTPPACGAPMPERFYLFPFCNWLVNKRWTCFNCMTLVERGAAFEVEVASASNTGAN